MNLRTWYNRRMLHESGADCFITEENEMNHSHNTPKESRDEAFYRDNFTDSTNWGVGEFESYCESIGFVEPDPDDFFGHRASRLWEAMNEKQKAEFASDFDDWLDA